ncbi:hypothetical protein LTR66_012949 [Elasticomyces elasticus]|nr:hypothetical protein LTR66_012949 [Elasticomyces elasticus]
MSGAFGNTTATPRPTLAQKLPPTVIPKSQYSAALRPTVEPHPNAASPPHKSPRKLQKSSRRSSPDTASRILFDSQDALDKARNEQIRDRNYMEAQVGSSRPPKSNFSSSTTWNHQKSLNKLGQPVEGLAIQYVPAHQPRSRARETNKSGNGLYQAANSSHISLQQVSQNHSYMRRPQRPTNGSKDIAAGGPMSSVNSEKSRERSHRSPTQKNMLSQALAKANTAVILDNAGNIQGAIEAYVEACDILQEVMKRSDDAEDRKKLSAIRETYSIRIAELYDLDNTFEHLNKQLPDAPLPRTQYLQGQNLDELDTPTTDEPPDIILEDEIEDPPRQAHIPPRQESLLPEIFGGQEYLEQKSVPLLNLPVAGSLGIPMDAHYMPPPLSPRKDMHHSLDASANLPQPHNQNLHLQSHDSTSWLDTVVETNSTISSRRASAQEKQNLDQIRAQYDRMDTITDMTSYDGFRSQSDATPRPSDAGTHTRNASEAPHDMQEQGTKDMHMLVNQYSYGSLNDRVGEDGDYAARHFGSDQYPIGQEDREHRNAMLTEEDIAAQEEEELLDLIMAKGNNMGNVQSYAGVLSSLPRESDSSGFSARSSGRTWESSLTTTTSGTALSTLAESPEMPQMEPPGVPEKEIESNENFTEQTGTDALTMKQTQALPQLPAVVGIRNRRMSGQGAQQLKIETFAKQSSLVQQQEQAQQQPLPPQLPRPEIPPSSAYPELSRSASNTNLSFATLPLTPVASVTSADSFTNSPATPNLARLTSHEADTENQSLATTSFSSIQSDYDRQRMPPPTVRPNTSSSNLKNKNLSLTTSNLDSRPITPGSAIFPSSLRRDTSLSVHTPAFSSHSHGMTFANVSGGGLYLFDSIKSSNLHSYITPTSATALRHEVIPLEPCPTSTLLRPFWLMRSLYTILSHPRGGYLTTKLFVPREIWRTRNVKLKAIEDKIAQCDVLAAALLVLGKVDTFDADAVLEELQRFENVIDDVRQALSKKLSSDVGVLSNTILIEADNEGGNPLARVGTGSSMKSFTSGWKKLRSKSTNATASIAAKTRDGLSAGQDITIPTVPMTLTSHPQVARTHPRHPANLARHLPPTPTSLAPHVPVLHASYVSSLARLFDAAQVLDSIARQVEDPGLKATNKTQVGIELGIKGCAEFFGFYILRFVLADIGLVLDKYLKRNGEWICS